MAVEAPGERGVVGKPARVSQRDEVEPEPLVGWIGSPEPLIAPEVGQSAIDAHAGSGADQERIGRGDRLQRPGRYWSLVS